MKRLVAIVMFLVLAVSVFAAKTMLNSNFNGYTIQENTTKSLELEFNVNGINTNTLRNDIGTFTEITIDNGFLSREIGTPALPTFRNLIEIPSGAETTVEIVSYDEVIYSLADLGITNPIAPVQPSYSKSIDPSEIVFEYNKSSYELKSFSSSPLATITKSGEMRGVGIGSLVISPIQYNPTNGTIKVYENLEVKVNFKNADTNAEQIKRESYSPFFENSYSQLINYKSVTGVKDDLTNYPITYLIVANDNLEGNSKLNEFISWKKEKGFKVVTNFVSSSTSISTIDSWIEGRYNNLTPKPSFVLIVGDESGSYCVKTEENPSIGSGGSVTRSDLLYGVIGSTGSSNRIPSMYVGRFSVRSLTDLTAQVDKTIWYEKGQFTSNYNLDYLENVMVVAGADASYQGNYGNPHVRYGMTYYFNDTYVNPTTGTTNGINGMGYLDGASGQASNIRSNVSNGLAFYNYTAHGSQTSFGDPSFTVSNVNSLTNNKEYPLIIGNCCLTGSFGTDECFGEAWLNAENKGSIGYIGASMSTYWDEDLAFGVGEAASGNSTPSYSPNKPGSFDGMMRRNYPTQAGMKHVGLLAVETYGGSKVDWYWSAYHLFGDPSLMLYMGVPTAQTATNGELSATATSFTVNTTANAYVSLSDDNGNLHGAAIANSSGVANISITNFNGESTANLVVTSTMKKPYFKSITVGGGSSNQAPTCDITAPNSGSTYTIGTDITISVDATDAAKDSFNEFDKKNRKEIALRGSKSVTKVEFYANGSLLGSDSSAPYSFSFSTTGYSTGSLSLTAKTTDDEGLTTSSDAVYVTLESGTPPTYLYAYDFESGTDNWTIKNSTEGFQRGTGSSLSMGNGSGSNFLGANSDKAGNNGPHVTDYANSPSLNFAGYSNLTVKFDYMLRRYQEFDHLYVVYRTSSSSSWITIEDLAVTGDWESWTNHTVTLPTGAQANGVQLAFFYDDNSGWGYGAGFDNIEINGEASSNQAPTCEISSPSNNAEYTVGVAINITVNAQDLGKNSYGNKKNLSIKEINSKSVASVKFYIDNVLKYTDSSLPYSYSWTSAGVGTHAITAIAKDDMGLSTTSEKVNISLIEESNGSGETLPYTTNFNDTEGWTQSNDNCTARWETSATNKAGGTSSEIKAHWEQKDPATTSFISPEFNTTGMTSLELSFKHFFDYYGSGVTVKVQSSSNGTSWTDESWVVNPTGNMGAETKTVEITHNVGSTTQIAFVLTGNLYQFDDWYIDDVEVKEADGNTGGPVAVTALDEGFENGGSIPTGWSQSRTNGTTDWSFVSGGHNSKPSAANTGSYNALLYLGSTTANSTMLITPSMDLAGVSDATVEFYHAQALWSPDQDELKVYYRTTSSGSWNELAHYTSSVTDWTKRTIALPNVSGTYYLAFEGIAKYGYGASLDDVLVTGMKSKNDDMNNSIDSFTLNQNYPNPFNPITSISYSLNNASKVKIAVYNVKGEIVWNSGELRQNTGRHSFSFDGSRFNSGVFYYSLTVGTKTVTKKMILVK